MHVLPVFDVAVVPHRSFVRVAPSGELDLSTSGVLRARMEELWDSGWTDLVLDLRGVTFMDSTALHVLIDTDARARREALRFSIIDGTGPVSRILDLSGLREALTFVPESRIV